MLQHLVDKMLPLIEIVTLCVQLFPLIDDQHESISPRLLLNNTRHHVAEDNLPVA